MQDSLTNYYIEVKKEYFVQNYIFAIAIIHFNNWSIAVIELFLLIRCYLCLLSSFTKE